MLPNDSRAAETDLLATLGGLAAARPAEPADAILGVAPRVVVEPDSEQALAAILRYANDRKLAVIPRGGGTKPGWGNPPSRADIVLSTARLQRIIDHAWADLTVTVEAGCTMRALQDALERHGQRVAVDVLWPERATVGGVLSTNDSGALRLRFGALRDLIIGVTLALPDGTLAASGGRVVKNVAGYDLPKLATGALGTLGVITRVVFRLHPRPHAARTLSCAAADLDEMQRRLMLIQDSKLAHASVQVRVSGGSVPVLDVLFEGGDAGVEAQTGQLVGLLGAAVETSDAGVWDARSALWRSGAAGAIAKLSVLMTDIAAVLTALREVASARSVAWQAVFYGTGLGWLSLDGAPGDLSIAVTALRSFAESRGGSLAVLQAASAMPLCDAWGSTGDAQGLMLAVKRQFDPNGILNPGRFVGGL